MPVVLSFIQKLSALRPSPPAGVKLFTGNGADFAAPQSAYSSLSFSRC